MNSVEDQRRTRLSLKRLRRHPLAAPVSVVAIIMVGLGLGFLAGYIQMPPDDPGVTARHFDGVCPRSTSTRSVFSTTVRGNDQIELQSSLTIRMAGVRPYHAPSDQQLGTPGMARNLARCFIATESEVKHLRWSDGVFEIDLDIPWSNNAEELENGLVKVVPRLDHSTIWIDPCRPAPDTSPRAENTICRVDTDNVIELDIKKPLSPAMNSPFPVQQDQTDDGVRSSWHFQGSPPPIKADLVVPADITASSWIAWHGSVLYLNFINPNVSVDLVYLANNWDIVLCLTVVAFVLVRLRGAAPDHRRCRGWLQSTLAEGTKYIVLAVAALLLAFQVDALGALVNVYGGPEAFYDNYWPIASAVIVVPVWILLGAAFGKGRQVAGLAILGLLALAPVLTVAYIVPESHLPQAATVWLAVFCVAFVALLVTAGSVLWTPVGHAFGGADGGYPKTPSRIARVTAAVLVMVTFALAIAFPVGSLCNCGPTGWAKIAAAASELVWYLGYKFSGVIVWIIILVVVVTLADRLLLESDRTATRRLTPLAALLLTLAAPWNTNMSLVDVVSLPVWLLQFGVLWAVLHFVVSRTASASGERGLDSNRVDLLISALEATGVDSEGATTAKPNVPPDGAAGRRDAVTRLLNLGPGEGRVSNAREAVKIGALLAAVPVGIVAWTTFVQLGEKLQQFNGLFAVVVLALIELARWVFSAMLYGYFHQELPGKTGAAKALWFTAFWIGSSLLPLMIAQATGHQLIGETVYRSAQLGVFMLALAIIFDYRAVETGGGDFGSLKRLYNRQSLSDALPTLITGLGLVIALFQQLRAGSGFDAVSSLLDGIDSVLPLRR